MPSLRQIARGALTLIMAFAAICAVSQSGRLPSLVVTDTGDGLRIGLLGGQLPPARVLRLSAPDRLVLDFDGVALDIATTEVEQWRARGVRMAFHAESGSTRVVFDIPRGEQRWMQSEGTSLVVRFTSAGPKSVVASSSGTPAKSMQTTAAPVPVQPGSRPVSKWTAPVASQAPPVRQTMAAASAPSTSASRPNTAARSVSQPVAQETAESQTVPETHLRVVSYNGLLQVSAKGVPFKSILDEIATATGATVQTMTPIGGTEEIFEWGPAPPLEVIKKLFEGSPYNYLVISEPNSDSRISRILVTSTVRLLPGNDGPVTDDDTNPEDLSGIAPLPVPKPH